MSLENTVAVIIDIFVVPTCDGVSRLGLGLDTVLRPIFASLGLKGFGSHLGLASWSRRFQVVRLRILQRNGLFKFLQLNDFLFVVFAGKK